MLVLFEAKASACGDGAERMAATHWGCQHQRSAGALMRPKPNPIDDLPDAPACALMGHGTPLPDNPDRPKPAEDHHPRLCMKDDAKETIGCLSGIAILFLLVGFVSWLGSGPSTPPMSDAEFRATVAKMKADRRQRCIDNIRDTMHLWPKDEQKYASGAMAKCGDDDD
jgi:hypothetical protein